MPIKLGTNALIENWLVRLRDVNTPPADFRETVGLLTFPLTLAARADLETEECSVATPLTLTSGQRITAKVAIAVILRAGLGMAETIQYLLPEVSVHHIDMHRDEKTLQPIWGRYNLPNDCSGRVWLIPDPMLATGGSALADIEKLKSRGGVDIRVMCIFAAPEGIAALREFHPDVHIYTAAIDERLTTKADDFPPGYIWPGCGDAGDRQFST